MCLFTDYSESSPKAVLLHNGNSSSTGHSEHLQESYDDLSMVLEKIYHQGHRWMVCGEFKMQMTVGSAGTQNTPASYACRTVESETSIGTNLSGQIEVP